MINVYMLYTPGQFNKLSTKESGLATWARKYLPANPDFFSGMVLLPEDQTQQIHKQYAGKKPGIANLKQQLDLAREELSKEGSHVLLTSMANDFFGDHFSVDYATSMIDQLSKLKQPYTVNWVVPSHPELWLANYLKEIMLNDYKGDFDEFCSEPIPSLEASLNQLAELFKFQSAALRIITTAQLANELRQDVQTFELSAFASARPGKLGAELIRGLNFSLSGKDNDAKVRNTYKRTLRGIKFNPSVFHVRVEQIKKLIEISEESRLRINKAFGADLDQPIETMINANSWPEFDKRTDEEKGFELGSVVASIFVKDKFTKAPTEIREEYQGFMKLLNARNNARVNRALKNEKPSEKAK